MYLILLHALEYIQQSVFFQYYNLVGVNNEFRYLNFLKYCINRKFIIIYINREQNIM